MVVCRPGHYDRDGIYLHFVDLTAKASSSVPASLDRGLAFLPDFILDHVLFPTTARFYTQPVHTS